MQNKETFVIIHGAWHGQWCYYKLKTQLENRGHHVLTLDLPSLGKDRANPAEVTLFDHVDAVVRILDSLETPVIVMGHSYGGVVLSQVCEKRPAKVKRAVYLAAFMLQHGQSLFDIAGADAESVVTQNVILNGLPPVDGLVQVNKSAWVDAFYADCDAQDVNLAHSLLVPHPFSTFTTPVQLGANYQRVPKTYIVCLKDRAITPDAQEAMYTQYPETQVIKLQTSHSPFFSEPDRLATLLETV